MVVNRGLRSLVYDELVGLFSPVPGRRDSTGDPKL